MPHPRATLKSFALRGWAIVVWLLAKDRLAVGASLVTIVGLPIAIYQLWDLKDQRTLRGLQVEGPPCDSQPEARTRHERRRVYQERIARLPQHL